MDEQGLVHEARKGDLDSFNRLVLTHQERAFNLAYRILGDSDSASDATQEAFLSAYRNLRGYRGGSFRAWILRIVTNACYDELRRRKRRPAVSFEELSENPDAGDSDPWDHLPTPENGPEGHVLETERRRAIEGCLAALPIEFRTVAILADVQGYPYEEIASVIGVPIGTVKSRLARARARLRDCLTRRRELFDDGQRLTGRSVPQGRGQALP
ncbi:MAG TPA: sigma-70 family RNA polymerase sigma factor [Anaerolineales bacterium]|nr:sigma-70 family RNA polymerase sigma factor [Anaerolineales bacterium]